jgi:hypothetical protein
MVQGAYDSEDLIHSWTLTPEDHVRIAGKSRDNRLAFAVLLLSFERTGGFQMWPKSIHLLWPWWRNNSASTPDR